MVSVKTLSSSYPFEHPYGTCTKEEVPLPFFDLYIHFLSFFGLGVFLSYPARLAIRVPFAFLHILSRPCVLHMNGVFFLFFIPSPFSLIILHGGGSFFAFSVGSISISFLFPLFYTAVLDGLAGGRFVWCYCMVAVHIPPLSGFSAL